MKQAYWDLELIRLSAENAAVHLNKEFILIDNFDGTSEQINTDLEFVNHPVKLSFTIAIFCLSGRMSFQINLQDFELRANNLLVVLEGAIGEYRGMSDNTRIAVIAFASEYFQTALQIDATMTLQRRLYSSPLYQLSSEAMEESMAIYRLMKAKITETDNPFRKGALLGYTQVLTYNSYKYLLTADTEGRKIERKEQPEAGTLYAIYPRGTEKLYERAQYFVLCRRAVRNA